jgi:hypothetical protein
MGLTPGQASAAVSNTWQKAQAYAQIAWLTARVVGGYAAKQAGVCSGGGFVYAGAERSGRFPGYLGEWDSEHGASNNALAERGSAGVAFGGGGTELLFFPSEGAAGELLGLSRSGVTVGGYLGTPHSFPISAGAGGYITGPSWGGCKN